MMRRSIKFNRTVDAIISAVGFDRIHRIVAARLWRNLCLRHRGSR
jgi:hypothetical protein